MVKNFHLPAGPLVSHIFFLFSKHFMKQKIKAVKSTILGRYGEALALKFLLNKSYKHILSNYCIRGGEIDLIMEKNGILIFVEVKSRWSNAFGLPEEAITWGKKQKLFKCIRTFLAQQKQYKSWRLDVIALNFSSPHQGSVKHFINIDAD